MSKDKANDEPDHSDELTIAYMSGLHRGKELAQRTWTGLTDEEIQDIVNDASLAGTLSWTGYKEDDEGKYTIPVLSPSDYQFARAIEAKLKEKNT